MPKSCIECKLTDSEYCTCVLMDFYDEDYYVGNYKDAPAPWCPLVEIPPHRRLIDADEFLKRAIGTKCFRGDYALMFEELVGESTTIIEAEEDGK